MKQTRQISVGWLVLVQWVLAYEWLSAAWEKFNGGGFMAGIGKTLGIFASPKNPHDWYTSYLRTNVLPHAHLFGNLVRYGELWVGVVLAVGGLLVWRSGRVNRWVDGALAVTAIIALLLSWNFYLAAGWSNVSTAGINLVMGLVELVLAFFYANRALGRR